MPKDETFKNITCESLTIKHPVTKAQITLCFNGENGEIVIHDPIGHEKVRLCVDPDMQGALMMFGAPDHPNVVRIGINRQGTGCIQLRDAHDRVIFEFPPPSP